MEWQPHDTKSFWTVIQGEEGGLILAMDMGSVAFGRECGNEVMNTSINFLYSENFFCQVST